MNHVSAKSLYEAYNSAGPNPWKSWSGGDVPQWHELTAREAQGDGAAHQVIAKWIAVAAHAASLLDGMRLELLGVAHLFGVDLNGDEWAEALEGAVNDHFRRLVRVMPPERLHKIRALVQLANLDNEIERELALSLDTLVGEIGRLENQSEARRQTLADVNAQVEALKRERDYHKAEAQQYADRNRELENRAHHAGETLRGHIAPPDIDELRRIRGLEPLAPWETVPTPFVPSMRDTGDIPVLDPIEVVEIHRPQHHTDVSDLSVEQGEGS